MTDRQPTHPVAAQFTARWSPRAFADTPVTEAQMLTLLEAARWAPSSNNGQPWRFVWALKGEAAFDAIAAALVPFNRDWATRAGALVVLASKATRIDSKGEEVPNGPHAFDSGAAWMSLALQAHLSGLVAHAMGGFDAAAMAAAIALPAGHTIHATIAVGVQGDPATLPEALRAREMPNGREPLDKIAHRGSFA